MKSVIVYYSYSGNTQKAADVLAEVLKEKGEVTQMAINALDEPDAFVAQGLRALKHARAEIAQMNCDLSGYDLICLGTPVWAFAPAPAVNTFLDNCTGLAGKEVILFATYGSGAGRERCLNYIQDILAKKGAKSFKRFSIQQAKTKDKEFVLLQIRNLLSLTNN
jgi:flavodoxin